MSRKPAKGLLCKNCSITHAVAEQRCDPCYRYWRRNGMERPAHLFARQYDINRRKNERRREMKIIRKAFAEIQRVDTQLD